MSSLLDLIKAISESPFTSIVAIILFIAAIKGVYEFVKWIKTELNKWYQAKHDQEEKDESILGRLEKLETENAEQTNKVKDISETLENINNEIKGIREDYAKVTVALTRASLHSIYDNLKGRDFISEAEYETFMDLKEVYLASGGNAIFKNKIIPYVESLPVKQ